MKFFTFSIDEGRRKKFACALSLVGFSYERFNCSACGREWTKDILGEEISIALSNDHFPDFVALTYLKFVSENVRHMLSKENIQSYFLQEVNMVSKADLSKEIIRDFRDSGDNISKISMNPPPYYLLHVNERAKLHEKTDIVIDECNVCGYVAPRTPGMLYIDSDKPKYIDLASWDGSDLFKVKYFPGRIFCTERFFDLYHKYALTGLLFSEVEAI